MVQIPRLQIGGIRKNISHRVWYENTGHWPVGDEVVHHRDSDPMNNEFENLQLMSASEHISLHKSGENHHFYGKVLTKEHHVKITGENNHSWIGDEATPHSKYMRGWRARKKAAQAEAQ